MKEQTECFCCGGSSLVLYLNLGKQPPCNALLDSDDATQPIFPLETMVCTNCWHSQLKYLVEPQVLFNNYPYRTGVSETLRQHYKKLAVDAKERHKKYYTTTLDVLDIGCNDGTLLQAFKELGCTTYGVDPVDVPERLGVDHFVQSYWTKDTAWQVPEFDIITATNVLAHNDHPHEFLCNIKERLEPHGEVILEFPYAHQIIRKNQFDTIYHEHYSYFTVSSFIKLLQDTGLEIKELDETGIHGGSLRARLVHGKVDRLPNSAQFLYDREKLHQLHSVNTYLEFGNYVNRIINTIHGCLMQDKEKGITLIGFGASGKSSVFLNSLKFPVEYLVDETPSKIGKFSPGMAVPIVSLERLAGDERRLGIVIFSWNCLEESLEKIRAARGVKARQDFYYVYVPYFQMLHLRTE